MAKQNRKQKSEEYAKKYSDIPISYEERLAYFGFDDKSIFSFLKEHC